MKKYKLPPKHTKPWLRVYGTALGYRCPVCAHKGISNENTRSACKYCSGGRILTKQKWLRVKHDFEMAKIIIPLNTLKPGTKFKLRIDGEILVSGHPFGLQNCIGCWNPEFNFVRIVSYKESCILLNEADVPAKQENGK